MRRFLPTVATATLLIAAQMSAASAQQSAFQPTAKPVIGACMSCLKKFTPTDLMALLKAEGYGSVRTSAKTPGLVFFKSEGRLMGAGVNKAGTVTFIYAYGKKRLPWEAINLWNRKSNFSKAMITSKGANIMKAVLISGSGLPEKDVRNMARLFSSFLVPKFITFYKKAMEQAQ